MSRAERIEPGERGRAHGPATEVVTCDRVPMRMTSYFPGRDAADRADDAAAGVRSACARRATGRAGDDQRDPPEDQRPADRRRGIRVSIVEAKGRAPRPSSRTGASGKAPGIHGEAELLVQDSECSVSELLEFALPCGGARPGSRRGDDCAGFAGAHKLGVFERSRPFAGVLGGRFPAANQTSARGRNSAGTISAPYATSQTIVQAARL